MIESEGQAAVLVSLGVSRGLGYLFGKPVLPAAYGILPPAAPAKAARTAGFGKGRFDPFTGARIAYDRW